MPEKKRGVNSGPPTMIMASFKEMGKKGRMRMRFSGSALMAFAVGMPMIAGLFVELSIPYWLFSGVIFFGGFCLLWPEMGLYLIDRVPAGIAKIMPTRLLSRPDRRNDSE